MGGPYQKEICITRKLFMGRQGTKNNLEVRDRKPENKRQAGGITQK
jgi:hypothetical protein